MRSGAAGTVTDVVSVTEEQTGMTAGVADTVYPTLRWMANVKEAIGAV